VISEPDGDLQITWVSSVKYYDNEGVVHIAFDPALKPYLLQLKSRFKPYQLRNVISLNSFYSIRIYELLKQYENIGNRTFEINELREMLVLSRYYFDYEINIYQ
jgi:plasmid replication initiation protein